jgi:membrane-bound serine protease (ClpP class)
LLRKVCLLLVFLYGLIFFSTALAAPPKVYVVPLRGEVEPGWLVFLERSLEEAAENGAACIILELDTPGGYIDTAKKARQLLDDFPSPVYAYVKPHALSAGAYLALAADGFFMAPGSTIGAAEPRLTGGKEAVDEKQLSSWEAEMRAVAENQGKDPLLAAAMVRKEIAVEGVVSSGELLTLTALEAERLKFSDGTVPTMEELLQVLDLQGAEVVRISPTTWEILSGWLIKPTVATILLSLALLFLVLEVLTAGFGIAGLLSILCFGLYFGGHYFTGVSGWLPVFLFLFGIVLLLVEAFILGFGVFGVGGLVSVAASIVLSAASTDIGLKMLLVSFLISGMAGFLLFKYLYRRGTLRRFILFDAATREQGFSSSVDLHYLTGKKGTSITPLRPAGIVEIESSRYDVVSEGSYVPQGVAVEVVKVEGRRVVVRPLREI